MRSLLILGSPLVAGLALAACSAGTSIDTMGPSASPFGRCESPADSGRDPVRTLCGSPLSGEWRIGTLLTNLPTGERKS